MYIWDYTYADLQKEKILVRQFIKLYEKEAQANGKSPDSKSGAPQGVGGSSPLASVFKEQQYEEYGVWTLK